MTHSADEIATMTADEAYALHEGAKVVVLVECTGDDPEGVERTYPAGTGGTVTGVRVLPAPQGITVTICVGYDEDDAIVAVFDESDECGFAFRPASANERVDLAVEPDMRSAGAELAALSFRLEKHPDFAEDAARLREIAAWASVDRPTDLFRSTMQVLGAMAGAMRMRNYAFRDDRPISRQLIEMLDGITTPLPQEIGYVDQDTLPPIERRDEFVADVEMKDVRTWTSPDGVVRSLVRVGTVTTIHGLAGNEMVHAEGDLSTLLVQDTTARLVLRASGRSLIVVRAYDEDAFPAADKPVASVSAAAASLLAPVPHDTEVAAIIAAGLDMILGHVHVGRHATEAVAKAATIRDALEEVAR
jgi:hypothetical protein